MTERYEIGPELGRGSFGITYLGTNSAGKKVAIKAIDIAKSESLGGNIESIIEEISTLQDLTQKSDSKYISKYIEAFRAEHKGADTIFIISEYINGSSLHKYIQTNGGNLSPNRVYNLMLQLLTGLSDIHSAGYAHRDIKPDNIMITTDGVIKYIDFGLACLQQCKIDSCNNTCRGRAGTLLYMPPEFFNGQQSNSLSASQKHDVWSLGVVLFELVSGPNLFPFNVSKSEDEIKQNIARAPQYKSEYKLDDGTANRVVDSLLINNWTIRPTAKASLYFAYEILPY